MQYFTRHRALILFGLLLLLMAVMYPPLPSVVQAQDSGILEGEVVNGTAGGPEVGAGVPAVLRVVQAGAAAEPLETTTDADGRFRFEGLETEPNVQYWPEVLYQGVSYRSTEPYQFDGGESATTPTLTATVTVYETTDDDANIALDSAHLIAESFGQVLRISEIHLVRNSGDRTYVGRAEEDGTFTTLWIPLPQDAVGLAFEQDTAPDRFVQVEGGLIDTEPVPPGQESSVLFFSYHLMVTDALVPLVREFAYPVTNLNVLVAQPGLILISDQLQARGPQSFQGRQYEFYTIENLAANTPLRMNFQPVAVPSDGQGMPGDSSSAAPSSASQSLSTAATRGNQGLLRWFGFGLAALAVAGAFVYAQTSRRSPSRYKAAPDLAANPNAQGLLSELADLQERYEAGDIDKASYERRRAELYEEIKSL
jgi:hypothetical protein